jgi:hypothetical protein
MLQKALLFLLSVGCLLCSIEAQVPLFAPMLTLQTCFQPGVTGRMVDARNGTPCSCSPRCNTCESPSQCTLCSWGPLVDGRCPGACDGRSGFRAQNGTCVANNASFGTAFPAGFKASSSVLFSVEKGKDRNLIQLVLRTVSSTGQLFFRYLLPRLHLFALPSC